MDFKKYLDKAAAELNLEVKKILKEQLKEAEKTDKKLIPLLKAFIKSCEGGKGIRGMLVKLGFELVGGKSKEIIKIGAAYEIMHSAVLIHDDIIDKSIMRRDKPSLHQALGGNHYGISQAISLSDYGFFLSYQIICRTKFPDDLKIRALSLFSKVMMDTGFGQMLDVMGEHSFTVMKLKTACYTVSGPLQVGALLGGANEKKIRILGDFGEDLGIAFQIRDDILDSEMKGLNNAEKEVRKYRNRALKILPQISRESKMSKLLEQMAAFLTERDK